VITCKWQRSRSTPKLPSCGDFRYRFNPNVHRFQLPYRCVDKIRSRRVFHFHSWHDVDSMSRNSVQDPCTWDILKNKPSVPETSVTALRWSSSVIRLERARKPSNRLGSQSELGVEPHLHAKGNGAMSTLLRAVIKLSSSTIRSRSIPQGTRRMEQDKLDCKRRAKLLRRRSRVHLIFPIAPRIVSLLSHRIRRLQRL